MCSIGVNIECILVSMVKCNVIIWNCNELRVIGYRCIKDCNFLFCYVIWSCSGSCVGIVFMKIEVWNSYIIIIDDFDDCIIEVFGCKSCRSSKDRFWCIIGFLNNNRICCSFCGGNYEIFCWGSFCVIGWNIKGNFFWTDIYGV